MWPATWSANELVSANHSYGVEETTNPASINDKMSSNLSRKRNSISFLCLIRTVLIMFICSYLTISITTVVHARPMILQNEDATKGNSNYTSYTATLPDENGDLYPSEIQKAVCTVTAGDVKASAEAVTTKELKGVCRSDEISSAFSNLELKLFKELEAITKVLASLSDEIGCNKGTNTSSNMSTKPNVQFQPIPVDSKNLHNNEVSKDYKQPAKQAFASTKVGRTDITSATPLREREILIYNNTLLSDKNLRVFTYYWKIENFTKKIEDGSGIAVESPVFSIKGRAFKIKASFQHLNRDFLFLQLEDATLLAKSGDSISLETGGLFKEIQNNTFKYKISVLHQNAQRKKDLVSQDFDNHETGFLIPNSALLDSPFVNDDAVLIQIFLYL